MMLELHVTSRFKKDLKAAIKRGYKAELLWDVVTVLRSRQPLPPKYRDHELMGEYTGFRECHILPDWLLIYRVEEDRVILTLARTGTHSDLF